MYRPPNKHTLLFHSSMTLHMLFFLLKHLLHFVHHASFYLLGKAVMPSSLRVAWSLEHFFAKRQSLHSLCWMCLCLEISFPIPGLMCTSLLCLSVCMSYRTWPTPPALSVPSGQGRNGVLLLQHRGVRAGHLPETAMGKRCWPWGTGSLLELFLLCLLSL